MNANMNGNNSFTSGSSAAPLATHSLTLNERKELNLCGVDDVINFDDRLVELSTTLGMMTIEGEDIHIAKLDIVKKELMLCGKISGIYYTDKSAKKSRGLFGKEKSDR